METVAIDKLLADQLPPETVGARWIVSAWHTLSAPNNVPASATAVTVTTIVALADPQELVTVYEIVAVPIALPVTTPEDDTEAVAVPVDHEPPGTEDDNGDVSPKHTKAVPVIVPAAGRGFTVMG